MQGIQYNLYIGLMQKDIKTPLRHNRVMHIIDNIFSKVGISGYNYSKLNGLWEGIKEPTIKVSFINTFGIRKNTILNTVSQLKTELHQESILIEIKKVNYQFV